MFYNNDLFKELLNFYSSENLSEMLKKYNEKCRKEESEERKEVEKLYDILCNKMNDVFGDKDKNISDSKDEEKKKEEEPFCNVTLFTVDADGNSKCEEMHFNSLKELIEAANKKNSDALTDTDTAEDVAKQTLDEVKKGQKNDPFDLGKTYYKMPKNPCSCSWNDDIERGFEEFENDKDLWLWLGELNHDLTEFIKENDKCCHCTISDVCDGNGTCPTCSVEKKNEEKKDGIDYVKSLTEDYDILLDNYHAESDKNKELLAENETLKKENEALKKRNRQLLDDLHGLNEIIKKY